MLPWTGLFHPCSLNGQHLYQKVTKAEGSVAATQIQSEFAGTTHVAHRSAHFYLRFWPHQRDCTCQISLFHRSQYSKVTGDTFREGACRKWEMGQRLAQVGPVFNPLGSQRLGHLSMHGSSTRNFSTASRKRRCMSSNNQREGAETTTMTRRTTMTRARTRKGRQRRHSAYIYTLMSGGRQPHGV